MPKQQDTPMRYSSFTGEQFSSGYAPLARDTRVRYPNKLWTYNPWTGTPRARADIGMDPTGLLIIPSGEPAYADIEKYMPKTFIRFVVDPPIPFPESRNLWDPWPWKEHDGGTNPTSNDQVVEVETHGGHRVTGNAGQFTWPFNSGHVKRWRKVAESTPTKPAPAKGVNKTGWTLHTPGDAPPVKVGTYEVTVLRRDGIVIRDSHPYWGTWAADTGCEILAWRIDQ